MRASNFAVTKYGVLFLLPLVLLIGTVSSTVSSRDIGVLNAIDGMIKVLDARENFNVHEFNIEEVKNIQIVEKYYLLNRKEERHVLPEYSINAGKDYILFGGNVFGVKMDTCNAMISPTIQDKSILRHSCRTMAFHGAKVAEMYSNLNLENDESDCNFKVLNAILAPAENSKFYLELFPTFKSNTTIEISEPGVQNVWAAIPLFQDDPVVKFTNGPTIYPAKKQIQSPDNVDQTNDAISIVGLVEESENDKTWNLAELKYDTSDDQNAKIGDTEGRLPQELKFKDKIVAHEVLHNFNNPKDKMFNVLIAKDALDCAGDDQNELCKSIKFEYIDGVHTKQVLIDRLNTVRSTLKIQDDNSAETNNNNYIDTDTAAALTEGIASSTIARFVIAAIFLVCGAVMLLYGSAFVPLIFMLCGFLLGAGISIQVIATASVNPDPYVYMLVPLGVGIAVGFFSRSMNSRFALLALAYLASAMVASTISGIYYDYWNDYWFVRCLIVTVAGIIGVIIVYNRDNRLRISTAVAVGAFLVVYGIDILAGLSFITRQHQALSGCSYVETQDGDDNHSECPAELSLSYNIALLVCPIYIMFLFIQPRMVTHRPRFFRRNSSRNPLDDDVMEGPEDLMDEFS